MNFFRDQNPATTFEILDKKRSRYNEIYVIQNGAQREMWFKGGGNFFLQSRFDMQTRDTPVLTYSRLMLASLLFNPSPDRVLVVGLGGGSIPNCLHHCFPKAHIDVVEVDKQVIDLCRRYFFLRESDHYRIHEADARVFIQNSLGRQPYDLILLDAFKSGSVPFHLKTCEFYKEISYILSPQGVVASNLYGKSNLKKPSDLTTFVSVFSQIYCFEDRERIATVLVAGNHEFPWSEGRIRRAAEAFQTPMPFSMSFLASSFRPDMLKDRTAAKFMDDFKDQDFRKAVEENNTHRGKNHRYPIKSHN